MYVFSIAAQLKAHVVARVAVSSHAMRMKNKRDRIAAAIRASRRAKGLSQEQLAEKIGVAPEHLFAPERGVNAPVLETLGTLVPVLGLDAARLLVFRL